MTNVLKHLCVDVHCDQCGDFTVGADIVAESQRLLAEGCPGSMHECPPQLFATLLDPGALASFERAWNDLEHAARNPARHVSLDGAVHVGVQAHAKPDTRAVARWEDDGGSTAATSVRAHRYGRGAESRLRRARSG